MPRTEVNKGKDVVNNEELVEIFNSDNLCESFFYNNFILPLTDMEGEIGEEKTIASERAMMNINTIFKATMLKDQGKFQHRKALWKKLKIDDIINDIHAAIDKLCPQSTNNTNANHSTIFKRKNQSKRKNKINKKNLQLHFLLTEILKSQEKNPDNNIDLKSSINNLRVYAQLFNILEITYQKDEKNYNKLAKFFNIISEEQLAKMCQKIFSNPDVRENDSDNQNDLKIYLEEIFSDYKANNESDNITIQYIIDFTTKYKRCLDSKIASIYNYENEVPEQKRPRFCS